jgi:very-short-patch-repair endonuclease
MSSSIPLGSRRSDLLAAGWSNSGVQRALRKGLLRRVAYDTYVSAGQEVSELGYLLASEGRLPVLSHRSAARAWGLPVAQPANIELTVPRGCSRRSLPTEARIHQSDRAMRDLMIVDGVRVTSIGRTLLDLAQAEPFEQAVIAIDAAVHGGLVTTIALNQLLADYRRSPGMRRVTDVVEATDGRAESPLETLLRLVLVRGGLPPDDIQRFLRGIGRVDFWYAGVVVEADGFAYHSDRASFRDDRRRNNACAAAGLLVLRFTWEDVHQEPDQIVAAVRAALRH